MNVSASRRSFLRGNFSRPVNIPVRPPWSLIEASFTDTCTRCNACLRACPESIIVAGDGGFPEIAFSNGACSFCGDCAAACEAGALRREPGRAPWTATISVFEDKCILKQGITCRVCGDHCEAGAISFRPGLRGSAQIDIDQSTCTGCGACKRPCPADAINLRTIPLSERSVEISS